MKVIIVEVIDRSFGGSSTVAGAYTSRELAVEQINENYKRYCNLSVDSPHYILKNDGMHELCFYFITVELDGEIH